jgi:hypothetical protein
MKSKTNPMYPCLQSHKHCYHIPRTNVDIPFKKNPISTTIKGKKSSKRPDLKAKREDTTK